MKTKYLNLAIAFIVIIAMSACKKDQSIPQDSKNDPSTKILTFKNMEEYQQTLKEVSSLTSDERVAWEDAKGFKSFGRASDEFYLSLDPEKLNLELLKDLVRQNPDYLQLLKGEDGEYTLESAFWDNPERRMINTDKMYQIGETIYKVFSFGTVCTNARNINKLKGVTEINYLSFKNDAEINFLNNRSSNNILKDAQYDCGKETVDRVTNGKDRIYIRISNFNVSKPDINFPPGNTVNTTEYNVRAYKKTLGIWYWCVRRISCSIKIVSDVFVFQNNSTTIGQYNRIPFQDNYTDENTDNIQNHWDVPIANTTNAPDKSHFGGYNCWASTPSAGPVIIQCNTQIVN